MTQLKIKVTKEILERSKYCGEYKSAINCAIALSVRTIWPDAHVYLDEMYATKDAVGNAMASIALPVEAREFIEKFDRTIPHDRPNLPELEFTIDIPDAVIEQINIEEIRPLLINHPTLELVEK